MQLYTLYWPSTCFNWVENQLHFPQLNWGVFKGEGALITITHTSTILMLLPQISQGWISCTWTTASTLKQIQILTTKGFYQWKHGSSWVMRFIVVACSRVSTSLTARNSWELEVGGDSWITFTAWSAVWWWQRSLRSSRGSTVGTYQ